MARRGNRTCHEAFALAGRSLSIRKAQGAALGFAFLALWAVSQPF